ncbi:hypothetical protein SISNIDRAFT_481107 [Sistotremastrum niveocremeum HHB9708]|uniref:RanBD1 domain-containing protein n=1 Tax=Sistotremastrum niveocremeum HHB9708 TaxID=1314777 RepID=A0A165A1K3_9AGAM|nr:hypothetical protein SISNIDRAFT_481107 [Sistotremastrum niveocremeum HHB9708]
MKRRNTGQHQQRGDEEEPEDDEPVATGLQKADEATLAARPMKGMPKRGLAGATSATETQTSAAPLPKFFSNVSSSSFSFTPSAPAATPTAPLTSTPFSTNKLPSFSAFGSSSSVFTNGTSTTGTSASTAPLSSTSTFLESSGSSSASANREDISQSFYAKLRGLNVSFLENLQSSLQKDPLVDISSVLEQYKNLRNEIESKSATPVVKNDTVLDTPPAAMPTPPSTFNMFNKNPPSSSASLGASGGFTPKLPTASSTSNAPGTSPFSFGAASSSKPFSFGSTGASSSAAPASSESSKPTPPAPSFSGFFTTSVPKPATEPSDTKKTEEEPAKASSASLFSKPKATEPKGTDASAAPSFSFGGHSNGLFGSSNPFTFSSSSSTSAFGNTSTSTPAKSSPFAVGASPPSPGNFGFGPKSSFGSGKGSFGNPVGFSFASPPSTPAGTTATKAEDKSESAIDSSKPKEAPATTSAFGLSVPATADSGSRGITPLSEVDSTAGSQPDAADEDEDGPGEEDESTVISLRCSLSKLGTTDGKQEWKSLGVGYCKIKKHNDTGVRRILMRETVTKRIILNFNLYPQLTMSVTKKTLRFIGHEDGTSQTFILRHSTEANAHSFKDAIDREKPHP